MKAKPPARLAATSWRVFVGAVVGLPMVASYVQSRPAEGLRRGLCEHQRRHATKWLLPAQGVLKGVGLAVTALQQIRKMRGGAQSHLMLGSDGHAYVVKFQNNGQNLRVLAAEYLATKLAALLGLTVPHCDVVEVSEWLVSRTRELTVEGPGGVVEACRAGLQFGSRLVGGLMPGQTVDYLPEAQLGEVKNLPEFAGMLVLDKWTSNANGRQAVFQKRPRQKRYEATFIDQGYCFCAGDWTLKDNPLRGVYARNLVYAGVTGWGNFEPWMSRLEKLDPQKVWEIAEGVPPEWYGGALSEMEQLVEKLLRRRGLVPELIGSFRASSRAPFPNWMRGEAEVKRRLFVEPGVDDRVGGVQ